MKTRRLITERQQLVSNGGLEPNLRARRLCLDAIEQALAAIDPSNCVRASLKISHGRLHACDLTIPIPDSIKVLSVGKASLPMIETAIEILKDTDVSGILIAPKDEIVDGLSDKVKVFRSSHPLPDKEGAKASDYVISSISNMHDGELLVCMISGGASAMLPSPAGNLLLEDKRKVTELLIKSRATIHEINTVRRHLSSLKGGRLVALCSPANVLSFIISDVSGNVLSDVASGLTAPDPTTFRDAVNVLQKFQLWNSMPGRVKLHLQRGLGGQIPETPKPRDLRFRRVHNFIIADGRAACSAAKTALESKRTPTMILTSSVDMEAKSLGSLLASIASDSERFHEPLRTQGAVILSGETTVEVRGTGTGGRNQETALAALEQVRGLRGIAIATVGTDGIDGNSPAAGAIIDGNSSTRARRMGLDARNFMERNDSYNFFRRLRDNIVTGPTHTNVGDLYILVRSK